MMKKKTLHGDHCGYSARLKTKEILKAYEFDYRLTYDKKKY